MRHSQLSTPAVVFWVNEEERHVARTHLLAERLACLRFGDHVAEDAEHRESAVGQLSIQLLCLLLGVELRTEKAAAVISIVLVRGPPRQLNEGTKGENLS